MARTKQATKLTKQKKWLKTIRKGWEHMGTLKDDLPDKVKKELPSLDMLKAEVNRLAEVNQVEPKPRVSNWKFSRCVRWLETQEPEVPEVGNDQEASDTNEAESVSAMLGAQISPRRSGTAPTFRQLSPGGKSNWSEIKNAPVLANLISLKLMQDYLNRDKTLSRLEIDAKQQNWFWEKLAIAFNEDEDPELTKNMFAMDSGVPEKVRRLVPERPDGLIVSASMLKDKHTKLRTVIQKAMNKFQVTGNGDNADTDLGDQVHSNDLSSYFPNNAAVYYFYLVLQRYQLLESFSIVMPDKGQASVTSTSDLTYNKKRKRSSDSRTSMSSAVITAMNKVATSGITINQSDLQIEMQKKKKLKADQDYLKDRINEYKGILADLRDDNLGEFLREFNEDRKLELEEEIRKLRDELRERPPAPILAPNNPSTSPIEDPPPASLLLDDDSSSDAHPLAPVSFPHSAVDDLQTPCDMPNCRVKHGLSVLPSTHVCGNCHVNLHAECCADDQNTVAGGHVFKCDVCFRLKSTQ